MEGQKAIGAAHALGHAGAVIALGAGAVSFAQTARSAERTIFTCVLWNIVLGTVCIWQVYATQLIIGGVSSLSPQGALVHLEGSSDGAVTSNIAFASRAVLSKATMEKPVGENMGPANLYAPWLPSAFFSTLLFFLSLVHLSPLTDVLFRSHTRYGMLTIIATILTFPFAFYFEGGSPLPSGPNRPPSSAPTAAGLRRQMALDASSTTTRTTRSPSSLPSTRWRRSPTRSPPPSASRSSSRPSSSSATSTRPRRRRLVDRGCGQCLHAREDHTKSG